MLTIGEFAFHGQVSARMLRHYDALGLLVPARIDARSGYRHYDAGQLSRLNRLISLKDLGFPLEEIGPILDADLTVDGLRRLYDARRRQIQERIAADSQRLVDIDRRLRTIEKEHTMSDLTFTEQPLEAVELQQRTASVTDQSQVGPTIGPMFGDLVRDCAAVGIDPDRPTIAWYVMSENDLQFGAGMPVQPGDADVPGTQRHTLPAAARAIVTTHHGDMATIGDSWQALHQYIGAQGLSPDGPCREVYRHSPLGDEDNWITDLQQPVA